MYYIMSKPVDKILYDEIKKQITAEHKPSAYRSGLLVKTYKQEFKKKHGSKVSPYIGKSENLKRWFEENWVNQRGEVGYKKKGDIYRPTNRISKNTPKTWSELTPTEIKQASNEKRKTGRVRKF